MAMTQFKLIPINLYNHAFSSSSGGSSSSLDTQPYAVLPAAINVNARTSGTATTTITVEHSSDDGATDAYTAVPESALYNLNDGSQAAFSSFSTTGTAQALGLNLQQTKRYIRVTFAGTSISQDVAVVVVVQQDYSDVVATF